MIAQPENLSEEELDSYLASQTPEQQALVRHIRAVILMGPCALVEKVDDGKWFGGMLTYSTVKGTFSFALGPRKDGGTSFHAMALYCCKELSERHGAVLKKFMTGKSCMKFKRLQDVPEGVIEDIVAASPKAIQPVEDRLASKSKS